jgi:hypothetical protein
MKLKDKLRPLSPKIKYLENLRLIFAVTGLVGYSLLFSSGWKYLSNLQKLQEAKIQNEELTHISQNTQYFEDKIEKSKRNAMRSFYFIIPSYLLVYYSDKRYNQCMNISGMKNKFTDKWTTWNSIKDIPVEEYLYNLEH